MTSQTCVTIYKASLATSLSVAFLSVVTTAAMPGNHVYAVFKLHDMPDSLRVKEGVGKPKIINPRIAILGSIPELGTWNFKKAIKASPSQKFNKWEARVLIPAGSTFEWSWIILDNKCTNVLTWDPCRRTTSMGKIGGTIHVGWNRPAQVFKSDTCGVEVSVSYHCVHGQYLVLTGGEPALGNWNPYYGVEARELFPPGSGRWTACLVLERVHLYQWKWVVVEGPDRQVVRWESSINHDLWIDEEYDRVDLETAWEKHHDDFIQSRNYQLRPDNLEVKDEVELLTVAENLQHMEEMAGRRLTEKQQPRRPKQRKPKVNKKDKSAVDQPGNLKKEPQDTPKVDNSSQKPGFSLFSWLGNLFSTYRDLVEG